MDIIYQFLEASESGDLFAVERFVSSGDVNPKAMDSYAFILAASKGHLPVVDFLINHCNPNALNSIALRLAATNGHLTVVEFLLPHSDTSAKDYEAFRKGVENGHRDIARSLQKFVPWRVLKDYV